MKKIGLIILMSVFGLSLAQAHDERKNDSPYAKEGSELPDFKVLNYQNEELEQSDFKKGGNLFIIMFNPTCGHCIEVAKTFGENAEAFKNHDVLFLAGEQMMPYFDYYFNESNINKFPQYSVAVDKSSFIEKVNAYQGLPQVNIYDQDRKLIKQFFGNVPMKYLEEYVE